MQCSNKNCKAVSQFSIHGNCLKCGTKAGTVYNTAPQEPQLATRKKRVKPNKKAKVKK